jgi:hypothetical protein
MATEESLFGFVSWKLESSLSQLSFSLCDRCSEPSHSEVCLA